jgi:cysteine desulfurase/selenocysteine lyase
MNKEYKQDFPIFKNNPSLIYLDSTATSQKPQIVIDWIKSYLETTYSSIHRWLYDISEKSESLYKKSKKIVLENIWANSIKEIIYTYNSTYALNLLASSLKISNKLKKWDKVLLSITEHNANLIPWLILKEEVW